MIEPPTDHERLIILLIEHARELTVDELRLVLPFPAALLQRRDGTPDLNLDDPAIAAIAGLSALLREAKP